MRVYFTTVCDTDVTPEGPVLRFRRVVVSYLVGLVMTLLMGSLQAYRLLISPLLGSRCRFHPSCSAYAQSSLQRFGPFRGGLLAVKRLLRCGPWHDGGVDEVPATYSPFRVDSKVPEMVKAVQCDRTHEDKFSPSRS